MRTARLRPLLTASLRHHSPSALAWKSTPDQQHWDFTLRKGAVFANRRPVTSADVKYSLERVARKGSTSPVALQLEPVTGFRAFNVDGTAPGLAGIVAPAPNVVHIDLDQPLSSLPAVLGSPVFGIVPKDGAADRWIRRHGAGDSVDSSAPDLWTPALRRFLDSLSRYRAPSAEPFYRRAQTGALAAILDGVRR